MSFGVVRFFQASLTVHVLFLLVVVVLMGCGSSGVMSHSELSLASTSTAGMSRSELGMAPSPKNLVRPTLLLPRLDPKLPKGMVVLRDPNSVWQVFNQCSRSVPAFEPEIWNPSVNTVVAADKLLSSLTVSDDICRPPRPFGGFIRQYVGVTTLDGVRKLYVNAAAFVPEYSDDFNSSVTYCDGGPVLLGGFA